MSQIDQLLGNAQGYARSFDRGDLPSAPARKVAVVTCMDARIDPCRLLGLDEGDAHVIRNAGGLITEDVIRSLSISQGSLGTEEIALIRHTDCAAGFADLEQSVREGVAQIEASEPIQRTDRIRGFVYDVKTGELREVPRSR
jgi:carbonic anhydrase